MLFWGMGVEFKAKIMSNYSRKVKWQQVITTRIGFCVYNFWAHSQNWCLNSVGKILEKNFELVHFFDIAVGLHIYENWTSSQIFYKDFANIISYPPFIIF